MGTLVKPLLCFQAIAEQQSLLAGTSSVTASVNKEATVASSIPACHDKHSAAQAVKQQGLNDSCPDAIGSNGEALAERRRSGQLASCSQYSDDDDDETGMPLCSFHTPTYHATLSCCHYTHLHSQSL